LAGVGDAVIQAAMPSAPAAEQDAAVTAAIERDGRRVVVFDDDPTGTQTVSDVDVLFGTDHTLLDSFFASGRRALWILTNTRAFPEAVAVERLKTAHSATAAAGARAGIGWFPILRGDSTLRGHVFAEVDVIASANSVTLFVPAFPEGGRVTFDGQHWLRIDGIWHNVADTEFARDAFFGYRSRRLVDWVAEMGGGRHGTVVPLDVIRRDGAAAIRDALLAEPDGGVVIPEQQSAQDIGLSVLGLLGAEGAGRAVSVRSAATFAAARSGLRARVMDGAAIRELGIIERPRVLVACGSHTDGAGRQLTALEKEGVQVRLLDRPSDDPIAVERTAVALQIDGVAAIATPRRFVPGTDFEGGAVWMRRLSSAVKTLAPGADVIVAKGGITSADLASALGAHRARVEGQLEPGIALWTLHREPAIPYAVVPGNVGDAGALVRVVSRFRPSFAPAIAGR
jgi:uncharacterized protein YgbK (DUF1537 family)